MFAAVIKDKPDRLILIPVVCIHLLCSKSLGTCFLLKHFEHDSEHTILPAMVSLKTTNCSCTYLAGTDYGGECVYNEGIIELLGTSLQGYEVQ